MRAAAAFALLISAACASSHPETARPTTESVRVVGDVAGGSIRMTSSDGVSTTTVAFAPDKVWGVLAAVYDSLGIPIGTADSKRMLIGNTGFKAYQKLGKTSLAKYIDCGKTQGFPSADSYDIYLQITTQVQPKDQGSVLSTFVEAAGRPVAFSGEYIKCSSLGSLESAIAASVRGRLNGK
jgi:hypothetical protein